MRVSKWNKELIIKTIKNLEKQIKRRPVKRDNSNLYFLTRKFFGTWNNAMKSAGYRVFENQTPLLPKNLTHELSYFLGLLITDGHMQLNRKRRWFKLSIFTSYEEEVKIIQSLIESLFRYKSGIYERKQTGFSRRSNYDVHINSKELIEHLKNTYDIPVGAKSLTVKMPKFVFSTSKENIGAFIRGVIDGDGSVKKWSVDIASGSYFFLKDIKEILNKFRIKSNKIYKDRTCMILRINKKENLDKLYSLIYNKASFYYLRKKNKFEIVIFKNA